MRSAGEEVNAGFPPGISGWPSMARSLVGVNTMDTSGSKPDEAFKGRTEHCNAPEVVAFSSFLSIMGKSSISRLCLRVQMAESMVSSSDTWAASRTDSCKLSS